MILAFYAVIIHNFILTVRERYKNIAVFFIKLLPCETRGGM